MLSPSACSLLFMLDQTFISASATGHPRSIEVDSAAATADHFSTSATSATFGSDSHRRGRNPVLCALSPRRELGVADLWWRLIARGTSSAPPKKIFERGSILTARCLDLGSGSGLIGKGTLRFYHSSLAGVQCHSIPTPKTAFSETQQDRPRRNGLRLLNRHVSLLLHLSMK